MKKGNYTIYTIRTMGEVLNTTFTYMMNLEEKNISNTTEFEPYQIVWTNKVIFRVTILIIVMVLTIIGNTTLILLIMCNHKQKRKRVNIFLVNLAVGDLMVCLFTMNTEILFVAFGEWVLGAVACKLIVYGQIVTLASATFLLTGMSIDRYQVIVQPLRSLTGQPKIWQKVLTAWIFAFIFAMPQLLIFVQTDEGVYTDGTVKHLCRSQGYTQEWQRKAYFSFLTVYILLVPIAIMSFCYLNIICVVWKRTDSSPETKDIKDPDLDLPIRVRVRFRSYKETLRSPQQTMETSLDGNGLASSRILKRRSTGFTRNHLTIPKKLVVSSKRKVVKMTLSVIIGFLVCKSPYFIVSLVRIFSDYTIKLSTALDISEIMALVHSALNPVLYGIFSFKVHQKDFVKCIKCQCSKKKDISRYDDAYSEDFTSTFSLYESRNSISHRRRANASNGQCNINWEGLMSRFETCYKRDAHCSCPCSKKICQDLIQLGQRSHHVAPKEMEVYETDDTTSDGDTCVPLKELKEEHDIYVQDNSDKDNAGLQATEMPKVDTCLVASPEANVQIATIVID